MHIRDLLPQSAPTFSFEFFPPRTPVGADALFETIRELEQLAPHFVSVTYGAGGSTREMTHDLVVRMKKETTLDPVPHLTCVCHTEEEIHEILTLYAAAGVSNILALGGDPPRDKVDYDRSKDAFLHASDLVRYTSNFNRVNSGRGFGIGVAGFPEGHPATPNRLKELDYLKAKVDAGADYICTQLFFDNHDFHDFRERCALNGINVPIIAGLMPVSSRSGMERMADLASGARFPAALISRLRDKTDDASFEAAGIDYASEQCQDLLENRVDGIHFYTLNKSKATREIYSRLGLARRAY